MTEAPKSRPQLKLWHFLVLAAIIGAAAALLSEGCLMTAQREELIRSEFQNGTRG